MAWVGIKHDGSTWTRVGDGQDAEMDPLGWYYDVVPIPTGSSTLTYLMIVLNSSVNSSKNMKLMQVSGSSARPFICEKEIV